MSEYALYKILGCSKESSYEELKRNFRKLALQHHPDKMNKLNDPTDNKFWQIEEAWKILRNPDSRLKYDAECRQAQMESQSVLVYTTITAEEMDITADDNTLSYQCRCGSYYLADREVLAEKNCTLHIPCEECTFVIIVET